MSGADEVWAWLFPAVHDLTVDQGEGWDARRRALLEQLGLHDPGDHPVVESLLDRLDELPTDERDVLLGGDQLEALVYELVQQQYPETVDDPYAWVADDQRTVFETAWGTDWPAALSSDLTGRWGPDWTGHPAEHKAAWLHDLMRDGYPFTGSQEVSPEQADAVVAELTEVLADIPGFEQLSEAEVAELVSEALQRTEG